MVDGAEGGTPTQTVDRERGANKQPLSIWLHALALCARGCMQHVFGIVAFIVLVAAGIGVTRAYLEERREQRERRP